MYLLLIVVVVVVVNCFLPSHKNKSDEAARDRDRMAMQLNTVQTMYEAVQGLHDDALVSVNTLERERNALTEKLAESSRESEIIIAELEQGLSVERKKLEVLKGQYSKLDTR